MLFFSFGVFLFVGAVPLFGTAFFLRLCVFSPCVGVIVRNYGKTPVNRTKYGEKRNVCEVYTKYIQSVFKGGVKANKKAI